MVHVESSDQSHLLVAGGRRRTDRDVEAVVDVPRRRLLGQLEVHRAQPLAESLGEGARDVLLHRRAAGGLLRPAVLAAAEEDAGRLHATPLELGVCVYVCMRVQAR